MATKKRRNRPRIYGTPTQACGIDLNEPATRGELSAVQRQQYVNDIETAIREAKERLDVVLQSAHRLQYV